MITTFFPPYSFGGDGVFVAHLARALASRHHEVDVIHCVDSYRTLATERRVGSSSAGYRVHPLRSGFGWLAPLVAHQSGHPLLHHRALRQLVHRGRHDVVHFHNISLFGPGVLGYGIGVKLFTLHEHWLLCQQHTLFRMNREVCRTPTCIRCSLSYRRPPQWWRWSRLLPNALDHVDCLLAPTQSVRARHQSAGVSTPIVHLPHFVPELPASSPASDLKLPATPFVLFVGRLEKIKGIHTIVPLFQARPDLHLVIAGEGSYASTLRDLAKGAPNVHFVGKVSGDRIAALYRSAVALIVPSLVYESSPLVAIEAMSAGTPVIVRDLGSLPEVASEGGGFIYRSETELARHVDALIANRPLRRERGAAARRAYERLWSEDVHVTRYLDLIGDVQARKRSASREARGLRV